MLSLLMKLFTNTNDITSKYNLYFNIESTFRNLLKIQTINDNITINKVSKLISREIIFDSFQLVIILILASALIFRIVKITNFSEFTLMVYENMIDRSHLDEFSNRCEIFL